MHLSTVAGGEAVNGQSQGHNDNYNYIWSMLSILIRQWLVASCLCLCSCGRDAWQEIN